MRIRGSNCRPRLLWVVAAVFGFVSLSSPARAGDFFSDLASNFQFNGYAEAQQIWRNENFAKNYHIASLRNRLDLQPSGQLFHDISFGPIHNLSVNYFAELRPGYEGAYDLVNDRFGNDPTGFSGTGYSPFISPINKGAGVALLHLFKYDVKSFKFYGSRDFAFPEPIAPSASFQVPCQGCVNVNVPERDLKFERDDSNRDYYPLREAYFDFNWDMWGANLIRVGKQQIVWGKADFFRLQDIINPVDFSQHFFIEPFEDTRIPQMSLWFQHRFGDIAFFKDLASNIVWNFDQFNPVGLGQGGQPWAVEFGDAKRAFAFNNGLFTHALCLGGSPNCNSNNIDFALDAEHTPQWRLRNDGVGMKWDWQIPQGVRFALTDYWGIRDTPAFVNTRLNVLGGIPACGSVLNGGVPVTLGSGAAITVVKPDQIHLKPGVRPDIWIDHCTLGGEIQIRYKKVNTLGLSADYFEPHSGLVFRVESSWTHNANLNDTNSLTLTSKDDILAYVFGMDLPHFIHFLNPDRTFFSSFQVFETYYPGAHSTDGGKRGIITGVNNFTLTAFTQTHYYRDQIIPLLFGAFGTEGTDATIGGDVEWLITDHWSARVGLDAFLGKQHQHDVGTFTQFNTGTGAVIPGAPNPFTESAFGAGHMQAGGAERNVMDEFWTRIRYRF